MLVVCVCRPERMHGNRTTSNSALIACFRRSSKSATSARSSKSSIVGYNDTTRLGGHFLSPCNEKLGTGMLLVF